MTYDPLTIDGAATVLHHEDGGLKNIPDTTRVVIALTKVTPDTEASANELAAMLTEHQRIDRVVKPMKTSADQ